MIIRIWRGWTTLADAPAYERLLRDEILPGIATRNIPGYRGVELLRHAGEREVKFITLIRFERWEDIMAFAGRDTAAWVPEAARGLLRRYDERATHYELIERLAP